MMGLLNPNQAKKQLPPSKQTKHKYSPLQKKKKKERKKK
jgi:hypothetical protein